MRNYSVIEVYKGIEIKFDTVSLKWFVGNKSFDTLQLGINFIELRRPKLKGRPTISSKIFHQFKNDISSWDNKVSKQKYVTTKYSNGSQKTSKNK